MAGVDKIDTLDVLATAHDEKARAIIINGVEYLFFILYARVIKVAIQTEA